MIMKRITLIILSLAALAVVSQANAAVILGVTIEDSSATNAGRVPENTINGSGFSTITGYHSKAPDPTMWLTGPNGSTPISSLNPGIITFDLEAVYDLDSFKVWNYNEKYNGDLDRYLKRGAKDVEISVASTVGGSFTSLGNFVFNMAPGLDDFDFSQTIDLSSYSAADTTRLVRFTINSSHTTGQDVYITGLSEVQFYAGAVPEPSRALLCIVGGMGLILRRRRS